MTLQPGWKVPYVTYRCKMPGCPALLRLLKPRTSDLPFLTRQFPASPYPVWKSIAEHAPDHGELFFTPEQ
eukprot:2417571-Karenia_brevis.AAC.1